jgi:anhydro-N-acetylmuramic acid kinase
VAGIMSGTSLDGIDVAILDIRGRAWDKKISVLAYRTVSYPKAVRQALLAVSNAYTHTAQIARLHFLLGELYASTLIATCQRSGLPLHSVKLIGCHGQTIFHEGAPVNYLGRRLASTFQIGEGSVIAERTGIPVVSDFRTRDVAAGGHGAPLVPYVDYLLLRDKRLGRVVLNIGGIANLTAIPAGGRPDHVLAFDTGPGNMVVDALVSHYSGGQLKFDRGGRIAAQGQIHPHLLKLLLRDPYYRKAPPKTAVCLPPACRSGT